MLAAFFDGNRTVTIRQTPTPEPNTGQVLVQVLAAALCGSDMKHYYASEPHTVVEGHETVGVVIKSRCSQWHEGDRVILYALSGCLHCPSCHDGAIMYCPDLSYVLGGFGEYTVVRAENCLPVPDWMTDNAAALFGDCVGLPWHTFTRLFARPGKIVLIVGLGPVGLSMVQMGRALGLTVLGLEPNAYRREMAQRLGAEEVFAPNEAWQDMVRKRTSGHGPDIAIDCAGREETQLACMRICRKGGNVGFVGGNTRLRMNPVDLFLTKELHVSGSWYFNIRQYDTIIEFIHGRLDPADLVTHQFPLHQADKAFGLFAAGDCGKVILVPNSNQTNA